MSIPNVYHDTDYGIMIHKLEVVLHSSRINVVFSIDFTVKGLFIINESVVNVHMPRRQGA